MDEDNSCATWTKSWLVRVDLPRCIMPWRYNWILSKWHDVMRRSVVLSKTVRTFTNWRKCCTTLCSCATYSAWTYLYSDLDTDSNGCHVYHILGCYSSYFYDKLFIIILPTINAWLCLTIFCVDLHDILSVYFSNLFILTVVFSSLIMHMKFFLIFCVFCIVTTEEACTGNHWKAQGNTGWSWPAVFEEYNENEEGICRAEECAHVFCGDSVSLKIPHTDRTSTDISRVPCIKS